MSFLQWNQTNLIEKTTNFSGYNDTSICLKQSDIEVCQI